MRRFHPRPETLPRRLRVRPQPRGAQGDAGGGGRRRPGRAGGPDAIHLKAQDRVTARAAASSPTRRSSSASSIRSMPIARLKEQAAARTSRRSRADNFRWRYYGLFYVAPAQNSYMCRLRIPNGILKHWQFAGVADLAERCGGGYAHVTTRANLQIREIEPKNAVEVVEGIAGSGPHGRAARAPTTSATSPARRPPASIRRN